ncbi:PaaI family thioesterase [Leptospira semungkisensis]|nr:hotdog fold thioesterase [Leptospira semungkisensis]
MSVQISDWEVHFRALEKMYKSAPVNQFFLPELSIPQKGEAIVTIQIREDFFHAAGATHGAVYFKAADDAAFFAANSVVKDSFVLTSNFFLNLLRPIKSGTMTAKGRVVQNAANLIIAESFLFDDRGREIGRGNGSFAKTKLFLSKEMGYDPDLKRKA